MGGSEYSRAESIPSETGSTACGEKLKARNRSRRYRPIALDYPNLSIRLESKDLMMSPKIDENSYLSNL